MSPTLWIVATPLGNLGDFSPRAREVLAGADLILAEDTRRTGQLLNLVSIDPRKLISLHEHNEEKRIQIVHEFLEEGKNIALVSDAGTPLMADPGYRLVRSCRDAGYTVSPVPGPSAVLAALTASGLPPYPFSFIGFLPRKKGEMKKIFTRYVESASTLVFFERKNRVVQALDIAHEVMGRCEFCIARELTKQHEQFIFGVLGQDLQEFEGLRGEVTIVVAPPEKGQATNKEEVYTALYREKEKGGTPKKIVRRVQDQVQGWTGKEIYALLMEEEQK